jgi:hydrogenase nickel incorporation protein HypA/HybF
MHEASIALGILDIAEEQCLLAGCSNVHSISVNVGRASGVLPDALLTVFDLIKPQSAAENAKLLINEIPLGGHCADCGLDFSTDEPFILECPNCKGSNFKLDSGRELDVVEIEAD